MLFLSLSLILGVFLLVLVSGIVSDATHASDVMHLVLIASLFISGVWLGAEITHLATEHPTTANVSNESTSKEDQ